MKTFMARINAENATAASAVGRCPKSIQGTPRTMIMIMTYDHPNVSSG
jgi:hypothetical protein